MPDPSSLGDELKGPAVGRPASAKRAHTGHVGCLTETAGVGATAQSTRRCGDAPPAHVQHRRGHGPRRHRTSVLTTSRRPGPDEPRHWFRCAHRDSDYFNMFRAADVHASVMSRMNFAWVLASCEIHSTSVLPAPRSSALAIAFSAFS